MSARPVIDIAARFAAHNPPPVCAGCPDGAFEAQVRGWLSALAEQLTFELMGDYGVREGKLYQRNRQSGTLFRWHHAETAHAGGGKTIRLTGEVSQVFAGEGPLAWAEPLNHLPPEPVDPLEVVLHKIGQLEDLVRVQAQAATTRHGAVVGLLQRLMVLLTHYATLPFEASVRVPVLGEFTFSMRVRDDAPRMPASVSGDGPRR
jgi:hypothetical protein